MQVLPSSRAKYIGSGNSITRLAVSYTPTETMRISQWSFVGEKITNREQRSSLFDSPDTLQWEIRSKDVSGNMPGITVYASGSFDYRMSSSWYHDRLLKFAVNLTEPIVLTEDVEYYFVIRLPEDIEEYSDLKYPFAWYLTYPEIADSSVYVCEYATGADTWITSDNSIDLSLYVHDDQAGAKYHVVIDGKGYMQPDNLSGYQAEMVSSGLAQARGGQSEYSQLRYPWTSFSQDDFSSGDGQLVMSDQLRFWYERNMDTTVANQAILGPKIHETAVSGTSVPPKNTHSIQHQTYLPMMGPSKPIYYAQSFTSSDDYTITSVEFMLKVISGVATTAKLYFSLYSDDGDEPGTILFPWQPVNIPARYGNVWVGGDRALSFSMTTGTKYWLVIKVEDWEGTEYPWMLSYTKEAEHAFSGSAKLSANWSYWWVWSGADIVFRLNGTAVRELDGDIVDFAYGLVNATKRFYCLAGKKVYQWNNSTNGWDAISGTMPGGKLTYDGVDLEIFDDDLYVTQGYSGVSYKWDGTSWTSLSINGKKLFIGQGYLWASTGRNSVRKSNDGTTWAAAITVGETMWDITEFAQYGGLILVGKEDGIWEIDTDNSDLALTYTTFRNNQSANNCNRMVQWAGSLYIPVQYSIWRWANSSYSEVGPADKATGQSDSWQNLISSLMSTANMLWAASEPIASETSPWGTLYGDVLAYNGLGWHHIATHESEQQSAKALYVTTDIEADSAFGSGLQEYRVWFSEGKTAKYFRIPIFSDNRYDWSDADYNDSGGTLVTSWWDGGLKDAIKYWNRLTVFADIPEGTQIEVFAALDGGRWDIREWEAGQKPLLVGVLTSEDISDTGEFRLMFPDGLSAKSIQLIFNLITTDDTKSPRLKAYNLETMVRQVPTFAHTFSIHLADNLTLMDGSTLSDRSASQQWSDLVLASQVSYPVIVSFPNESFRGMISYLRKRTRSYQPDGTQVNRWDTIADVTVIEAT